MTLPARSAALEEELQQKLPFVSEAHKAIVGVLRTASVVTRSTGSLLSQWDLTVSQYNVLRILRGAGSEGLATLAIRERMIDPAAAITRLLDKLESAALVHRERTEGDRRQVRCTITEKGLAVLCQTDGAIQGLDQQVSGCLNDAELGELNRMLGLLRAEFSAPPKSDKATD